MNLVDELKYWWALIDAGECTEEEAARELVNVTDLVGARNLIHNRGQVRYVLAARERGGEVHG